MVSFFYKAQCLANKTQFALGWYTYWYPQLWVFHYLPKCSLSAKDLAKHLKPLTKNLEKLLVLCWQTVLSIATKKNHLPVIVGMRCSATWYYALILQYVGRKNWQLIKIFNSLAQTSPNEQTLAICVPELQWAIHNLGYIGISSGLSQGKYNHVHNNPYIKEKQASNIWLRDINWLLFQT